MYKLVLVDDESDIREGLQEVVDFPKYGFAVAGEAANGLEAVQVCERVKPDLVITDIRMPLMDGLAMLRQVKKLLPTARFIILSGYDDFEYARQAIAVSCLGYLLKPISSPEFIEMLLDAKKKLDEEFDQRRDLTRLRQHFRSSLPLLRENLLSALVSGGMTGEAALETAQRYEMPLTAPQYLLALIRPEVRADEEDTIDDPELMNFAVMNVAQEILEAHGPAYLFHHHGLIAALLLLPAGEEAFTQGVSWLDEARKTIDHYLKTRVLMGVGSPCERLDQLANGARQALSALDQCTILADQPLLCVTDLEPGSRGGLAVSEQALRLLGNALKLGNPGQAEEILTQLMAQCREAKPTPRMYRAYLLEIFMALLRTAQDMSLDPSFNEETALEKLMACPPPEQAQACLGTICRSVCAGIRENRATSSRMIAQQAEEYLMAHYPDQELAVEKLCGILHISPSYFSVLFKKETKKTFLQYLTELRMDKAMSLLTGSEMKTVQIAQAVGIPDPSYFSYAFKRHFGVSPSQARRRSGGAT